MDATILLRLSDDGCLVVSAKTERISRQRTNGDSQE
jgi:hypothetical protein